MNYPEILLLTESWQAYTCKKYDIIFRRKQAIHKQIVQFEYQSVEKIKLCIPTANGHNKSCKLPAMKYVTDQTC